MTKHIKSTYKTIVKGHDQHYTENEKEHHKNDKNMNTNDERK